MPVIHDNVGPSAPPPTPPEGRRLAFDSQSDVMNLFDLFNGTTMMYMDGSLHLNEVIHEIDHAPTHPGSIDDELAYWLEIATYVILSGTISLLGSIANVVNVIVFARQGFRQSINISLLGLAISDLGSLLTLLWMSVCVTPTFRAAVALHWDAKKIQYLTAGWPHVCFARITSFITAFITFERCLCIALPLKVKRIITPARTVCVVVTIFVVMAAGIAPVFYAARFTMVFDENTNRSVLSFFYIDDGQHMEKFTSSFNSVAQLSSVVIVILCTTILVQNLVQKSQWRKSTASADESFAVKDKKVMKMVIFVATIFLVCFLPSAINLLLMICLPEYILYAGESNMFIVVWGFLNILEATNSSVNILIYYNMSTAYRTHLQQLLCHCWANRNKPGVGSTTDKDARPL